MTVDNKATFFARLEPRLAPSDLVRVRAAYYLAKYGHRAQTRKEKDIEGQPLRYFEHLRRVAINMMDEVGCYDPDLIITCLLHDTLEDTDDIDANIIEQFFGKDVARRVKMLTKTKNDNYIERLKTADEETILVKACDRLDNLRYLKEAPFEFQKKQFEETIKFYMPIFKKNYIQDPYILNYGMLLMKFQTILKLYPKLIFFKLRIVMKF
jgi:(p)ppGpp synthase/HD superfamily hydrolase